MCQTVRLLRRLGLNEVLALAARHRPTSEFDIFVSSLNDDITHATDLVIVGKGASVCLSVDLVVVCFLPNVAPSAPRKRALKVSRSRSSCLRSTSLFPQRVSSLWTTRSSRRTTRSLETLVTLAMRSTWLAQTTTSSLRRSFKIHNTCVVLHRCFPVFPDLPDVADFSECRGHPTGGKSTAESSAHPCAGSASDKIHAESSSNGSSRPTSHITRSGVPELRDG